MIPFFPITIIPSLDDTRHKVKIRVGLGRMLLYMFLLDLFYSPTSISYLCSHTFCNGSSLHVIGISLCFLRPIVLSRVQYLMARRLYP
jgi:hypothetical protein